MSDDEFLSIEVLYSRSLNGLQGKPPPPRIRAIGTLLAEVRELRRQVDALVEEREAA